MGRSAIVLHFDEPETYHLAADAAGNMAPFFAPTGLARPVATDGIVGGAREWSSSAMGLEALEAVEGAAALRRDCTIEVLCNLPWLTTDGTYRLVTRGKGTSSSERELWGLQVVVTGAPSAPVFELQMRWQRSGGSSATVPSLTFNPPPGWLSLAASRRWISPTEVEVAYYCNGLLLGTVTSAHGDIADGSGGTVMIGSDGDVTGLPVGSIIDEIRVSNEVRSAEELAWTYFAMFEAGRNGYELLRALLPPGDAYSQNPDSVIQRELMVAGDGLGIAWAKAFEIQRDLLPDRAWSFLEQWERVTRLSPLPTDSIEIRRARVVAFLSRVQGYNWAQVADLLAPLLDCDAADLQLIEHGAGLEDTFAVETVAWIQEVGEGNAVDIASTTPGAVTMAAGSGDDIAWTAFDHYKAQRLRANLPEARDCTITTTLNITVLAADALAGLFVWDLVTGEWLVFGVEFAGGVASLRVARCDGSAVTTPGGTVDVTSATTVTFRYRDLGDGTIALDYSLDGGAFVVGWYTGSAATARQWCGLVHMTRPGASAPIVSTSTAVFTDFALLAPQWGGVFAWYVYRDPGLGGDPDLRGARLALEKVKPAHTRGRVIESTVLRCDDPLSLLGREPLGV